MREILFRGMTEEGEWKFGFLVCFSKNKATIRKYLTNRECHEETAGMPLEDIFFSRNGIDPNELSAEYIEYKVKPETVGQYTRREVG